MAEVTFGEISTNLPKNVQKWIIKNAFKFPNVLGYSMDWMPAIINGKVTPFTCIRIYVVKKFPLVELKYEERIPPSITRGIIFRKSFLVDVVEFGEMPHLFIDKTVNFRPVELGVSVGNEAITAGSLGMLYKKKDGTEFIVGTTSSLIASGSNAHVVTPDAGMTPEEVQTSGKINILQRGAYHGGKVPEDVVGKYFWHRQVVPLSIPSDCQVSKIVATIINIISRLFGRKTRMKVMVEGINSIDFGLYVPTVEHILKIADNSIDPKIPFVGHLYAGSDVQGILCGIEEILNDKTDITPITENYTKVQVGDKVKGCSFWCNYETEVTDTNGTIQVNYGTFIAIFTNCIIVKNDGTIKGGWSGSGWFKVS